MFSIYFLFVFNQRCSQVAGKNTHSAPRKAHRTESGEQYDPQIVFRVLKVVNKNYTPYFLLVM